MATHGNGINFHVPKVITIVSASHSDSPKHSTVDIRTSGVIQPGDLLMSIQGDSPLGKSIDKLNARYSLCDDQRCPGRLAIVTQYTVADNVIPNCGVFDVRIIKRSASLGINLQGKGKTALSKFIN
ncbi:unnamed protein product [Dibothriocephalus latus]|uniref:PDZ domain-containing protein n=1 Tax=Dibothriocephalus latus TaxID=60516 RepID=A0A3P7LXB3_DIBLA|nr:unnamed protein product [Dibothriocephalus latus]